MAGTLKPTIGSLLVIIINRGYVILLVNANVILIIMRLILMVLN